MTDPKPKQAILIQRQWVNKIFDPDPERRKTWEIRSFNTEKRGLFAVGVTGESKLEGEVELVNSYRVAEKVDGKWQCVNDENESELNYLFSPGNYFKAGCNEQSAPAYLQNKTVLYAWEFASAVKYCTPKKWHKRDGAVVFANIVDKKKEDKKTAKQAPKTKAKATTKKTKK